MAKYLDVPTDTPVFKAGEYQRAEMSKTELANAMALVVARKARWRHGDEADLKTAKAETGETTTATETQTE